MEAIARVFLERAIGDNQMEKMMDNEMKPGVYRGYRRLTTQGDLVPRLKMGIARVPHRGLQVY